METIEVEKIIHEYYWEKDYNCATTMLKILAKKFSFKITKQVIDSAVGMHGAGKYGAQCGLVEGSLLFIGIYGRAKKLDDNAIIKICFTLADRFEKKFSSLLCSQLRPCGFIEFDTEHRCEELTVKAVNWVINFIDAKMPIK